MRDEGEGLGAHVIQDDIVWEIQLYYGKHEHERTGSFIWAMGCRLRLAVPFCVFNTCDRKANMCNVLQPRTIRLPIDLSWPRPKTNKLWHLGV